MRLGENERVCPFGIRFNRHAGRAKFSVDEAIAGPLENATSPGEILSHPWPKAEWLDFSPMLAECDAHASRVIIGGMWTGILGDCYRMRGFETFLYDMAAEPDMVSALVDRMTEFYLELNDRAFSQLRGKIDVWYFGNDFGSQGGLIFSREMFQRYFLDNYRKLIRLAHHYGVKVMCHSCGAIIPLIPDLIEAGIDLLDPVQTTAAGMDPARLKREFGDKLVFHGGVDTQHVLPDRTPEQVYDHCRQLIQALGRDGGYVFGSSNSIMPGTPVANIDAMYCAARECIPAAVSGY